MPSSSAVRFPAALACLLLSVTSVRALPEVEVRSDLLIDVDGQAFFPVGLLQLGNDDYPDWNDRIRQSGANFVWDIGYAFADSTPTCAALRDSAEATGYRLMVGSFDTWEWDNKATALLEVAVPMYPADSLQTLLDCFQNSDALIGMVNRDEPVWAASQGNLGDIDSAHVYATYEQLQGAAPDLPVIMNMAPVHESADSTTWVNELRQYRDAADIIMFTSYPYPAGPGTCSPKVILGQPDCSMDRLPDGIDTFRNHVARADQPIWANIQAHKGIPTRQARWEAWVSIIHGASGVLWAGHNWTHPQGNGADNWPVIAPVIAEVASLHDRLVADTDGSVVSLSPDLDVLGKDGESWGITYAFAASRRGTSGDMTLDLGFSFASWAEVMFENRWVPVVNSRIIDHFEAYEAHVYRATPYQSPPTSAEITDSLPEPGFHARVLSNPVSERARIWFRAPDGVEVEFAVFDVSGRRLAELHPVRSGPTAGWATWDGRDRSGPVPSGVYFLRGTAANGEKASSRIVLRR